MQMGACTKGDGVSLYIRDEKIIIRLDKRENTEKTAKTWNKICLRGKWLSTCSSDGHATEPKARFRHS